MHQTATASSQRITPRDVRQHLRLSGASSIGDTERLAGIITAQERHTLWFRFQEHFQRPTQELFDMVMADCHRQIARAVNEGRLSLFNPLRVPA